MKNRQATATLHVSKDLLLLEFCLESCYLPPSHPCYITVGSGLEKKRMKRKKESYLRFKGASIWVLCFCLLLFFKQVPTAADILYFPFQK